MAEGGRVEHMLFDCGGDCARAFMQWIKAPGVLSTYDTGINRGLGVPRGTFHLAFRCASQQALRERRRHQLQQRGVVVGELLDLNPYASFFFNDPVNCLRLEYTTRWGQPTVKDCDPQKCHIPASLVLFEQASEQGQPA